ncbi:copper-containing nitrite reductase [Devosia sp. YIM 151766]|uniref:copper-containing nitrite reductase n=1 Tax=Devosia sp. YIM 151766 TaxID=3017325 RepID=UPI00255CD45C|nr:copper-containing nitrite reductase [Devosia sp. YIM 151766]WIY53551.1 copper-containing nitrite reductase [Devosia sp. YIM 151766]
MTDTKDETPSAPVISRRSLLAGTAGLTLAGTIGGQAMAQQSESAAHQHATHMSHGSSSLSGRLYQVNPEMPEHNDIAHDPADVPPPITRREPQTIRVELETIELEAHLDTNSTFRFWTFNARVPGPFIRVRVGDTVECYFKNAEDSWMAHNVDFHATTGPGGGAVLTTALPGEEFAFRFKALNPGLYVYHCAVAPVALHIANGMYGMILVEPEEGLPPVDREFYVMQGELYTEEEFGSAGLLTESYDKLVNERPEYFVFNGHVGALTEHFPLKANVGETVRIFFGVGGPNFTSSFHVIGEIFDRVYMNASLTSPPLTNVQTVSVPPGGAAMVEFKCEVPGRYVLVDHALSRAERGLAGYLIVDGDEQPDIFSPIGEPPDPAMSGH